MNSLRFEIPMPIESSQQLILGEAYIPYQQYRNLFNINDALFKGTIFKELYRPYKSPYPIIY